MFEDIAGKAVFITGASSGLGASFARLFARYGAHLVIAARRLEALEALKTELEAKGSTVRAMRLDVTDLDSIGTAMTGAPGIDVLINNAGIAPTVSALDLSPEDWDRTLDTNLRGVFFVAQAAARRMKADARSGAIVNISSITALRPLKGISAYAASKAGVSQLTKVLALEWARYGIRVNALCPGYFETELTAGYFDSDNGKARIAHIPMRRLGAVDDLGGAILLLSSEAGRHITGIDLPVDGGHLLSGL